MTDIIIIGLLFGILLTNWYILKELLEGEK